MSAFGRIAVWSAAAAAVAAAFPSPAGAQSVTHRYSFNDNGAGSGFDVTDSVGGANGVLVNNSGGATISGGQVNFNNSGASNNVASNNYVDLPNNIIPDTNNYTVEGWATWGGGGAWQRIFDFGTNSSGEIQPTDTTTGGYSGTGYIFVTPQSGNDPGNARVNTYNAEERNATKNASTFLNGAPNTDFGANTPHQFVVSKAGNVFSLYEDGGLIARNTAATNDPGTAALVNDWLGRSNWAGDPFFNGSIDEFRIYDGAIRSSDVALDRTLGPDQLTATNNTYVGPAGGTGDYGDPNNWSAGRVPDGSLGDLGLIANGGTASVTNGVPSNAQVKIANGTLAITGTSFSPAGGINLAPGSAAAQSATVAVTGGGTLATVGIFADGDVTTTGSASKTISLDNGTLQATGGFTVGGTNLQLLIGAGGGTLDSQAFTMSLGAQLNGTGALNKIGPGTVALVGPAGNYSGAVNVSAGTLAVGATSLGSASSVTLNATTLQFASAGTLNSPVILSGGGTLDGGGNLVTVAKPVSGSGDLTVVGAGAVTLAAPATYNGATNVINGGTLGFAAGAIPAGSPITLNNGTLQWATGNTSDITATNTVTLAGPGTLDTNGNNVTIAGTINANGTSFTKTGAGTLTFQNTMTPGNFFVRNGTFIIDNNASVITTGTGNQYSSVGLNNNDNGTVIVRGNGIYTVNGDFNIGDVSPSSGSLIIQDTAAVSGQTLFVGKGGASSGAVKMTGGTLTPTTGGGDWRIGGGNGTGDAAAVGAFDVAGGAVTIPRNFQIGAFGSGQLNVTGGTVTGGNVGFHVVGRFVGGTGQLNVSGTGVYTQTGGNFTIIGEEGTGSLNVLNGGQFITTTTNTAAGLRLGHTATGNGSLNLYTGGTVTTPSITSNGGSTVAFNGGTLRASADPASPAVGGAFMRGLTNAFVFPNGGIIDTNGQDIAIGQPLLAPTGSGVTSVPVATAGAGYVAAPIVRITPAAGDTTGTGAVGVATLDATGKVTGITITNPGTGYTAPPVVTLLGGNPTTPATVGTIATAANTSGAITKIGLGTLTLRGNSTYAGGTIVNAGTLAVGPTLAGNTPFGTGAITLAGGKLSLGGTVAAQGLTAEFYANAPTNTANADPDYNTLTALNAHLSALTPAVTVNTTTGGKLDLNYSNANYSTGAPFNGPTDASHAYVYVPAAGDYTFATTSDDGSVLFIDGQDTPVVANNAFQGATRKTGTVTLTAGFHAITVGFYQGGGGNGLVVEASPAAGNGLGTISNAVLSPTNTFNAGQTYANDVNVTADANIDVTNSLSATLGNLTLGANTLSVTSADATTTPYSLNFGNVTLSAGTGSATIDVAASTGGGAGTVSVNSINGAAGAALVKNNAGTLAIYGPGTFGGGTTVNAGQVVLNDAKALGTGGLAINGTSKVTVAQSASSASPKVVKVTSLAIAGGATPTGTLDLTNNALVVDYTGASPISSIGDAIRAGYNGGGATAWTGAGITSSSAATAANKGHGAIGYGEASTVLNISGTQTGTFLGQPVDASSVLVRFTAFGDANLDGQVSFADFVLLSNHFGLTVSNGWDFGDFNYDNKVDFADFVLLSNNFGTLAPAQATEVANFARSAAVSSVPEPGSLGVLTVAGAGLLVRRRRAASR